MLRCLSCRKVFRKPHLLYVSFCGVREEACPHCGRPAWAQGGGWEKVVLRREVWGQRYVPA